MTEIRLLVSVAGPDISWVPGDVVDLPPEEAAKWADGYRAEYVTQPAPAPVVETTDRGGDRETTDTPRARTTKRRTR